MSPFSKTFFSAALLSLVAIFPIENSAALAQDRYNEFLDLDITQLMQVTITSVSKKPEPLADAAAAIFVISQKDIQRSGATTIQDALKLAPGVHVARITASKWAVTTRGFNGQYSNKLLVLIDGRTVYSPSFSGVYWDDQGTLLEDIERIEIIRGPGATLWGANAVNGVINIITKHTKDTTGGLVTLTTGTEEKLETAVRYGQELGSNLWGRGWFSYSEKDSSSLLRDGSDAYDNWESIRGGFRLDSTPDNRTSWTLQGNTYQTDTNQIFTPYWLPTVPYMTEKKENFGTNGWNLLAKLEKQTTSGDTFSAQIYYDFAKRQEIFLPQQHGTLDAELQYQTNISSNNDLTLGLGYRLIDAEFESTFQAEITPSDQHNDIFSGFIQDAITLIPETLIITLGSKWEHNDYTGNELQPSAKILWKPMEKHSFWGAVSKAVKVPSEFEASGTVVSSIDPTLPPFPAIMRVCGTHTYTSEEVTSYEAGYRWYPTENFALDLALFYNDYTHLLDADISSQQDLYTLLLNNNVSGQSYGTEMALHWQPEKWARFDLSYSLIQLDMSTSTIYPTNNPMIYEGSAPQHMVSLFSQFDLAQNWVLNVWLSYVDKLETASFAAVNQNIVIDEYFDADITLTYQASKNLKISLVGQNLLESENLEFVSESFMPPTEIERGVYLKAVWSF
jgi:iron complex outermembrane receptor protein